MGKKKKNKTWNNVAKLIAKIANETFKDASLGNNTLSLIKIMYLFIIAKLAFVFIEIDEIKGAFELLVIVMLIFLILLNLNIKLSKWGIPIFLIICIGGFLWIYADYYSLFDFGIRLFGAMLALNIGYTFMNFLINNLKITEKNKPKKSKRRKSKK